MGDDATVTVEAVQLHSYNGRDYAPGTSYEIAADLADSVVAQGKAKRVDRAAAVPAPTTGRREYATTEVVTKRKTALKAKRKT